MSNTAEFLRRWQANIVRLLHHACLGPVEFQQQQAAFPAGRGRNRRWRRFTLISSSISMRATGMPYWMVIITARQASSTVRKGAAGRADRLRNALQFQGEFGDQAQCALADPTIRRVRS